MLSQEQVTAILRATGNLPPMSPQLLQRLPTPAAPLLAASSPLAMPSVVCSRRFAGQAAEGPITEERPAKKRPAHPA